MKTKNKRSKPLAHLTPKQAAAILGTTYITIHRKLHSGDIPYVAIGKRMRKIPVSALGLTATQAGQLLAELEG